MRLMRSVTVALLALALAVGAGGFASQPGGFAPSVPSGMMAAAAPDTAMPECPVCVPVDAAKAACAPACAGLAAILAVSAFMAASRTGRAGLPSPARRLDGEAAGPEPHPPKSAILA
jgi:hypothetical protein